MSCFCSLQLFLLLVLLETSAGIENDAFLCCSSKRPPAKAKKSPVGNWLSFFHLGKSHSVSKRKLKRHPSEPNEIKSIALPGLSLLLLRSQKTRSFCTPNLQCFCFCILIYCFLVLIDVFIRGADSFIRNINLIKCLQGEEEIVALCALPKVKNLSPLCKIYKVINV